MVPSFEYLLLDPRLTQETVGAIKVRNTNEQWHTEPPRLALLDALEVFANKSLSAMISPKFNSDNIHHTYCSSFNFHAFVWPEVKGAVNCTFKGVVSATKTNMH